VLLIHGDDDRNVPFQQTTDFTGNLRNMSQSVVKIDPEIMSGAPCFARTRVPIQNLIDYLDL
jgi:Protein of unknown function (DUF433)